MRLVSWNMAYMKPASFKTVLNRQRQWALVGALSPDIALLQECRPGDLESRAPPWMKDEYDLVGELPPRWVACSAVLARKSFGAVKVDREEIPEQPRRWLDYLSGYVALAELQVDDVAVAVASVHAVAKEVDCDAVTAEDHDEIRRRALARAWHNDLAVAALRPWIAERPFIVGGDWNNALLFDTNYPAGAEGGTGASAEFFENRAATGWHHALRKFSPEEVRTYLDPNSAPYELDHVFLNSGLHERLVECRVFDDKAVAEMSDHAPLIADFS